MPRIQTVRSFAPSTTASVRARTPSQRSGRAVIGIAGTGFIGAGLALVLEQQPDVRLGRVLTRRPLDACPSFPRREALTRSLNELIDTCDLVIECSGDPLHAADVVAAAQEGGCPVVTINAEFHITAGSYFVGRGLLTEAEGDQPGTLAALHEEATAMGFRPWVYGNIKRFLNHDPSMADMREWAIRQGTSLPQTTAFTDGTKMQIEMALVANGLCADIAAAGLLGYQVKDVETGAMALARRAYALRRPIADYLLMSNGPPGVFITATHDPRQQTALRYFKLGDGPFYTLLRNYHLCHLEVIKTVRRVLAGRGPLLNNSAQPEISVAAIAKGPIRAGALLARGIGSLQVRGSAVRIRDYPHHVPIGLLAQARFVRPVAPGQIIEHDDVILPDSLALRAWNHVARSAFRTAG